MKYFFSRSQRDIHDSLRKPKTLFAFDFDGTLAPIVKDHREAKLSKSTRRLLSDLAKVSAVAVISGRSVSDLRSLIKIKKVILVGNHGLEGLEISSAARKVAQQLSRQWRSQLSSQWKPFQKDPGVILEDKIFTLALHYRRSKNKSRARKQLLTMIKNLNPSPRLVFGKCIINIIPHGAPHKGTALLEIMRRSQALRGVFVGDDDNDEDAFRIRSRRLISIRVKKKKASYAKFFVKSQGEVKDILSLTLDRLEKVESLKR